MVRLLILAACAAVALADGNNPVPCFRSCAQCLVFARVPSALFARVIFRDKKKKRFSRRQ